MKQSHRIQRNLLAGYVLFLALAVAGAVFASSWQDPVPAESRSLFSEESEAGVFVVTAYDLSIASCGKGFGHPMRGVTAAGADLSGLSRTEAKVVAADPAVLPLGTWIRLEFLDSRHREYDGIYQVLDTGGRVRGNHVDVFLGDFGELQSDAVRTFGRTKARVTVIMDGDDRPEAPNGAGTP